MMRAMPLSIPSSVDRGELAVGFAHLVRDDQACGVLVFNREPRLVFCSPNVGRLLDLDVERLVGASAAALPPRIRRLVEDIASSGKSSSETELLQRPGNPQQNLRLIALPLRDLGQNDSIALLVQDLSQARRLEEDIRQLDRLASVGTLAAEMAHEVKNAMVAVRAFVDLLLEQDPAAELAGTVRREMKRVDTIVAQVLKFSRGPSPTRKALSLHGVIERTLGMLTPQLKGRNITLVSRLAADPDTVRGDENHLEQAVLNLLLNATEAINGDGTLTVETDLIVGAGQNSAHFVAPRQLRVVIRDTGPGITTAQMSRLFEPFFTTKRNGTGLGLAITRRIIHEHHGLISAESEPGKGAAFQILLPAG
jgi:signal transduction histidine kinase